jgi:hypothetical protein
VNLHRRQRQLVHDVGVLDGERLIDRLALEPFGGQARARIAEPQPNVLNLASSMTPVSGFTRTCSFMTSPHSGAPTSPVPTFVSSFGSDPTLRGFS